MNLTYWVVPVQLLTLKTSAALITNPVGRDRERGSLITMVVMVCNTITRVFVQYLLAAFHLLFVTPGNNNYYNIYAMMG